MVGARTVTAWQVAPARRIASAIDVRQTIVSPDGGFLLLHTGNEASLWHLDSGRVVTTVKCTCTISELQFSPTGKEVVIVADDGKLRIRKTGVPGFRLDPNVGGNISSISFTADGARVAGIESTLTLAATEDNPGQPRPTGQEVKRLRVWDLRSQGALLTAQAEGPTSFSHDGRLVAAGRRVWEVDTGREITRVESPIVAFSPDSSYLITSEADRTGVWVRRPADLMSVACDTIRGMSLIDDWRTFVRGLPYPRACRLALEHRRV
jgi:WD40 repeat protein